MNKERYLSARTNNVLTIALGIPTVVFGIIAFRSPLVSDFWDFVGMAVLGSVY